jgi:threonine dehydrogenase-like Zn-dependent dehydrogenase
MEAMYGHRSAALYGYSHLTGGVPGGQADYVRVPFADVNCLVVPDDVPDEKALYLSDIVPTAYHGVEIAEVKQGSTVAICMSFTFY